MRAKSVEKMTRRRRSHAIRKGQAVSPVVATLILILVAVAAAAALYLWLVAWQGGVTKNVGNPNAQYTIAIGGSTTVFPVTEKAIPWFEANNSGIVVHDNPGGSGAGELSLCSGSGAIDIAAMSRPMKAAELTLCPTAVQTVIGYDAVVPMTAIASNGGITSVGEAELLAIYWLNGGQPSAGAGFPTTLGGTTPLVGTGTASGVFVPGNWGILPPTGAIPAGQTFNTLEWQQIPLTACYSAGATVNANGFWTAAGTSTCTYTYPAGVNNAHVVNVYARADNSGTEEAFDNNVLGISCGTDNQLASCGFPTTTTLKTPGAVNVATGNPAVLSAIAADKDSLGFNSWGLSTAPIAQGGGAAGTGSATVVDLGVQGNSQTGAVTASLTAIKTGIAAGYGVQVPNGYIGWRPLEYVTLGNPTGEPQRFIDFVLQPSENQILLQSNFYISVDQ